MIYRNSEMFRLLCLVSSSKNDLHIYFFLLNVLCCIDCYK